MVILSFAGRHLPAFLADYPLTRELPFLPDLARLEWLVVQAFHAFDQPPADLTGIASLSSEDVEQRRIVFQPSVGLVALAWPILDIWTARTTPRTGISINVVNRPQRVLVFRQGEQVRCEHLSELEHALLSALHRGQPLGQTLGQLAGDSAAVAGEVGRWVARWAGAGLIVRVA